MLTRVAATGVYDTRTSLIDTLFQGCSGLAAATAAQSGEVGEERAPPAASPATPQGDDGKSSSSGGEGAGCLAPASISYTRADDEEEERGDALAASAAAGAQGEGEAATAVVAAGQGDVEAATTALAAVEVGREQRVNTSLAMAPSSHCDGGGERGDRVEAREIDARLVEMVPIGGLRVRSGLMAATAAATGEVERGGGGIGADEDKGAQLVATCVAATTPATGAEQQGGMVLSLIGETASTAAAVRTAGATAVAVEPSAPRGQGEEEERGQQQQVGEANVPQATPASTATRKPAQPPPAEARRKNPPRRGATSRKQGISVPVRKLTRREEVQKILRKMPWWKADAQGLLTVDEVCISSYLFLPSVSSSSDT